MIDIGQAAFFDDGAWIKVERCHPQARALADGHYSRQTPGAREFMSSGITFVLLTRCARAVWGCIENLDPAGNRRKTRRKRDPGRCFRKAGWFVVDEDRRGLVILQAPEAA